MPTWAIFMIWVFGREKNSLQTWKKKMVSEGGVLFFETEKNKKKQKKRIIMQVFQ